MKNIFNKHEESNAMKKPVEPQIEQDTASQFRNSIETGSSDSTLCAANFPRTLYVQYETSWSLHTNIRVLDSDKSTVLYTVDCKYRKPQMRIKSTATDTEIATVNFHCLKSRIDMTFRGQEVTLQSGGFLGVKYSCESAILNGDKLTWQPRKKLDDLNMVLVNSQGLAIARFVPKYMSWRRGGQLEITSEVQKDEQLSEVVIVMALAVIHYKQMQRVAASSVVVTT